MGFRALVVLLCLGLAQARLLDLSCNQIKQFVDGHNTRRLQLAKGQVSGQPAAAEMKSVVWDAELAAKAAKWASHNKFQHNPDRSVGSGRFTIGENIHMFSTTDQTSKINIDSSLKSWFDEHKDFKYKKLENSDFESSHQIGHYTQMVWSESIHVGCGASQFKNNNGWNSFLVVCNYGPTGNYIHQAPYKSGAPSNKLICGVKDCSHPYGNKC